MLSLAVRALAPRRAFASATPSRLTAYQCKPSRQPFAGSRRFQSTNPAPGVASSSPPDADGILPSSSADPPPPIPADDAASSVPVDASAPASPARFKRVKGPCAVCGGAHHTTKCTDPARKCGGCGEAGHFLGQCARRHEFVPRKACRACGAAHWIADCPVHQEMLSTGPTPKQVKRWWTRLIRERRVREEGGVVEGAGEGAAEGAGEGVASSAGEGVALNAGEGAAEGAGEAVAPGAGEAIAPGAGEAIAPGAGEAIAPGAGEGVASSAGEGAASSAGEGATLRA